MKPSRAAILLAVALFIVLVFVLLPRGCVGRH